MSRMIAIDLGTSTSCVSVWDRGAPQIIPIAGRTDGLLPSVVTLTPEGYIVGQEAIEAGRKKEYRDWCFKRFKRLLGEAWNDGEDTGHQTCEGPDGLTWLRGPDGPVDPVDLSAIVIRELVQAATEALGAPPSGAVIGVPADFTEPQRRATEQAGIRAGLGRVELIDEPTAAATAYGATAQKTQRIAVYDLGGGTFDISAIQTGKGLVQVLNTNGNRRIGGEDFDEALVEWAVLEWSRRHPESDLGASDAAMRLLRDEAEQVKIRLSVKDEAEFNIPDIDRTPEGEDLHLRMKIDLGTFNALTKHLVDKTIDICRRSVDDIRRKDPNFALSDFHDIVLVGGMTRVRQVRAAVSGFFGKKPKNELNPEHVVAMGAAIKAAIIEGRKTDTTIADVISHTLSIATASNIPAVLFEKGTPFGTERTVMLSNARDHIEVLSIRLVQGDAAQANQCELLAAREIAIEPMPARTARIPLTARLDDSGRPHAWVGTETIYGDPEAV